jgi:arabinogalactan oligomer/maltooligosaccharide transport system permease protein
MALEVAALPVAWRRRRRFSPIPYAYLTPALVTIAILTLFPVVYTVYISFTNYNLYHDPHFSFIGLKNYTDLLSPDGVFASLFWPVFVWTVAFAAITSVLNYFAGFFLAVLLNNPRIPERAIYRTLLIVPWAMPSTITILVWQGLLNQSFGSVDALLTNLHLASVPWLTDVNGARAALFLVNLWLGFPFTMILCTGALQAIPADIYEAASIDGASGFDRLRLLTLPLVFRMTGPQIVSGFSFNFMNFGIVYLLTQGNPPRTDTSFAGSTDVLATFIYNLTLQFHRYDKGAALGIIIFLVQMLLVLAGFLTTGAFKKEVRA